eukprot:3341192-Pleurochrysis_carterae.AAC.1
MQSRERAGSAPALLAEARVITMGIGTMLPIEITASQGWICRRLLNTSANLNAGCVPHERAEALR